MRYRRLALALAGASTLAAGAAAPARAPKSRDPGPAPAIPALVAALRTHAVVAIGEPHGFRQAGDFYIALVRDTAFQNAVDDIVVEFASRQSQGLLDRYVLQGESLPADTVRSIWRNTTKAGSWEFPIYERWLRAIRDVDQGLPRARRIRVLAGDTRVDWTKLHTPRDWASLGDNNVTFTDVIERQVMARGRRALVVLGNNHLARGGTFRDRAPNTTTRVESRTPGSVFVALVYYGGFGDAAADARIAQEGWPTPALVPLATSWLGARPVTTRAGPLPLRTFADAALYLGPRDSLTVEAGTPADDPVYARELVRRAGVEWGDTTRLDRFLLNSPVETRTAPAYPMRYVVSPPRGWTPDREWPAILVVTDAYREFTRVTRLFSVARSDLPFILVTPLVLSGGAPAARHKEDFDYSEAVWSRAAREGACRFDERGIAAVLDDVRQRFHARRRFFITGWQAGGHVVLSQLLNHPERWNGAAVATPNFLGRCVSDTPAAPPSDVASMPIRMLYGGRDTTAFTPGRPYYGQWLRFSALAKTRGFTDVADRRVPDAPHGPLADAVMALADSVARR